MRKLSLIGATILALALLAGQALAAPAKNHRPPMIVAGAISVYGPPYEGAGTTASGASSSEPGIAMRSSSTLGRSFCVTLNGGRLHAVLRHIDWGPASWTGRAIDITGAGVGQFEGRGHIYTDARAHARLLPRHRGPEWRCGTR